MSPVTPPLRTPRATGLRCPALGGLNLKRRHLSEEQQAKQRRLATLKRGEEMPVSAKWREREEGKAAHHVANLFGVSPRAVERAEAVYRDGAPELVQAFESDEVSVSAAAEVATLPDDEQREVAAAGPDAMKNAAKAVRDDYATACGLTRSRVGKNCRCTKMDCTTLLVKGTSGHLKHAVGECRSPACFTRQILPVALSKWQTRSENQ